MNIPSRNLIPVAEFAERMGISGRAVRQAITEGRLTAESVNGQYMLDEKNGPIEYRRNTIEQVRVSSMQTQGARDRLGELANGNESINALEARALKDFFLACNQEAKFAQSTHELVPIDEVKKEIDELVAKLKSRLDSYPPELVGRVAHLINNDLSEEIEDIAKRLIEEVLSDFVIEWGGQ